MGSTVRNRNTAFDFPRFREARLSRLSTAVLDIVAGEVEAVPHYRYYRLLLSIPTQSFDSL